MSTRPAPTITIGGTALDPSKVALPLEIVHGRSGSATQPDAPTCGFTYMGSQTPPFLIGDRVEITLSLSSAGTSAAWADQVVTWGDPVWSWNGGSLGNTPRFTGRVALVVALESGGDVVEWTIGCVGTQAALGRTPIDISRPREFEQDRAQAIADAAGIPITFVGTSTIEVEADAILKDALSALHELAGWTAALVWQDKDGSMVYGFANHRATQPTAVLPSSAIVDGVEWDASYLEVVNHIVVKWGDPETQNTYRDDESIARWGYQHVEVSTKLAKESDVDELGFTILARRADPYWVMPGVLINSMDCDDAEYWEANTAKVGLGLLVDIPTTPGPVGKTADTWNVEGWVEVWDTADNQRLQLFLSDRQRWGAYALRKWSDQVLQPWSHWQQGYTWLEQLTEGII